MRDIALDIYNSFKSGKKIYKKNERKIKRDTSDPMQVGEVISNLVSEKNWQDGLSEGEIFLKWPTLVGDDIARNAQAVEIKNESLVIQCATTAWATQLNLMKNDLLFKVQSIAPTIKNLDIYGPTTPSWRKGLRTIKGEKGARDTYG